MDVRVIIAAGGSGSRFGQAVPKQFVKLGADSILKHTVRCFEICDFVEEIVVVLPPDFGLAKGLGFSKVKHFVLGEKTRAESVHAGLAKLCQGVHSIDTVVLIHDGVRPFASKETIRRVAELSLVHGAAITATKVTDTIKKVDGMGFVSETIQRDNLWRAATPQGFRMDVLLESYKKATDMGYLEVATDEAFLAEKAGFAIVVAEGNPENIKITTPADKLMAEAILKMRG